MKCATYERSILLKNINFVSLEAVDAMETVELN